MRSGAFALFFTAVFVLRKWRPLAYWQSAKVHLHRT
jgi:hypothetical protein